MKTNYALPEIEEFLRSHLNIVPNSVKQLNEGHSSQVIGFSTEKGEELVLRLRQDENALRADKYAYDHFASTLPIPAFKIMGQFNADTSYCITEYISGKTVDTLSGVEFQRYLPQLQSVLAKTFQADISRTKGYGDINLTTGDADNITWKSALENELNDLDIATLKQHAKNINLRDSMVDDFVSQFTANLPYVSEVRRLLHGDPGSDNVLVENGKVVAVVDWEQMAYGDWLRDFSRFEFWNNTTYGDASAFATKFNLESDNIKERIAVYWAINALRNIEFADKNKSEKVAKWMRTYGESKLVA